VSRSASFLIYYGEVILCEKDNCRVFVQGPCFFRYFVILVKGLIISQDDGRIKKILFELLSVVYLFDTIKKMFLLKL
jgi:hypothetical protein